MQEIEQFSLELESNIHLKQHIEDEAIWLIVRLINEPQRLSEMAANGRRHTESLSPEIIGLRCREVYAALMHRRSIPQN